MWCRSDGQMYVTAECKGLCRSGDICDLECWLVHASGNGLARDKDTWVMQRKASAQVGTSGVPKVGLSSAVT